MLLRLSILTRLLLAGAATAAVVAVPIAPAHAQDDWDDEDDDEDGGDDDEDDDEDGGLDKDQPPVTAGGLFTKETYPIAELERPLTLIKGMFEMRAGIDIDMSAETAFETWGAKVDARYGLQDHVELQAGFAANLIKPDEVPAGAGGPNFALYAGVEAAIAYDLVNFRLLAAMPIDPEFAFDIVLGFPFRYKPKPQVAIIALDRLMTIHTSAVDDGSGEESAKPDLTIGVGLIYQPLPQLALLGRGEVTVPRFNTDFVFIPVTAAVQFSPNNRFDLGGEFTFGDLKAEDTFAKRSLLLYGQVRL